MFYFFFNLHIMARFRTAQSNPNPQHPVALVGGRICLSHTLAGSKFLTLPKLKNGTPYTSLAKFTTNRIRRASF